MRTNTTEGVWRGWPFGQSRWLGAGQGSLGAHRRLAAQAAAQGKSGVAALGPRAAPRAGKACHAGRREQATQAAASTSRAGWPRTAPESRRGRARTEPALAPGPRRAACHGHGRASRGSCTAPGEQAGGWGTLRPGRGRARQSGGRSGAGQGHAPGRGQGGHAPWLGGRAGREGPRALRRCRELGRPGQGVAPWPRAGAARPPDRRDERAHPRRGVEQGRFREGGGLTREARTQAAAAGARPRARV
jgi:hypothetical protein